MVNQIISNIILLIDLGINWAKMLCIPTILASISMLALVRKFNLDCRRNRHKMYRRVMSRGYRNVA